jgi:hypothetical protein
VSNGRRFKRKLTRGVAFLLPRIPDNASPPLKNALAIRNAATTSGRCRCGAEMRLNGVDDYGTQHVVIEHEFDCPARIETVLVLLEADRQRVDER